MTSEDSAWMRLVRFSFRLLYNEFAWTYGPVSWLASLGQWQAWMAAAIPYLTVRTDRPTDVLEINHGPGHMLLGLHRRGYRAVGLDLSPSMGRQAQRRLHRGRAAVPLVRADVQAIPFPEMAFDHVLSTFPSEFITWPETLQNIHRVLRAEGRLVVIPLARFSGEGLPVRLLEWAYAITGQRPPALEETTNHPFWQALEGYGFKVSIEQVTLARSTVTVVIATKLL